LLLIELHLIIAWFLKLVKKYLTGKQAKTCPFVSAKKAFCRYFGASEGFSASRRRPISKVINKLGFSRNANACPLYVQPPPPRFLLALGKGKRSFLFLSPFPILNIRAIKKGAFGLQ
jgi:hypothetical protein